MAQVAPSGPVESGGHPDATASAIGKATLVIVVLGLLDKLFAVAREMLMAARFGVDARIDAFNIAYAYPGIVNLLFNGACVAAFVPLYASWLEEQGPAETRDNTVTVLWVSCAFFALLTLACHLLAPALLSLIGYGFPPATLDAAVGMERGLVWLVGLEGLGVIVASLLQSWKRFARLTLAQSLINLTIIAFLLAGEDMGVDALVAGFVVGTALKVAAMFASAGGGGLRPFSRFAFRTGALRQFARLGAPLLGSTLIANSNILIDQSMATALPEGGVAVLRYAYRVNDLPLQVVVMAVSRALFPYISDQAALGDAQGLRDVFRMSLVFIALVCLPITAYVLVFADDIVTVLLRRGAFDAEAARQTALTLRFYSLGLFFYAYTFINAAFFTALRQGAVLLRLGVLTLGLNFGLNWLFLRLTGGVQGIALSTAVTVAIVSAVFLALLRKHLAPGSASGLGMSFAVVAGGSLAAGLACLPLRAWAQAREVPLLVGFAALTLLFFAISYGSALVFRTGEITRIARLCLPRFGRTSPP